MIDQTGHQWQKACNGSACIEIATGPANSILIRDSKSPEGPMLQFTRAEWDAFARGVKEDAFNLD